MNRTDPAAQPRKDIMRKEYPRMKALSSPQIRLKPTNQGLSAHTKSGCQDSCMQLGDKGGCWKWWRSVFEADNV